MPYNEGIYHVSDSEKGKCLNGYFVSISSVDDSKVTLLPCTSLPDNSVERLPIAELR